MRNSVGLGLALLLGLGLAGCATRTAKAPSYDDRELRPLNQDLAAWLARLNVQPPVAAEPAVAVSAPVSQDVAPVTREEPSPQLHAQTNLNAPSLTPANGVNDSEAQASQILSAPAAPAALSGATAVPPAPDATSAPVLTDPAAAPTIAPEAVPATAIPLVSTPSPASASVAETPLAKEMEVASDESPSAEPLIEDPAKTPPAPELPVWTALPGESLRDAIQIWSQREGWQVEWDAQVDYDIAAVLTYRGSYLDAIRGIFKAHASADRRLLVDLYPTQKLIHVTE